MYTRLIRTYNGLWFQFFLQFHYKFDRGGDERDEEEDRRMQPPLSLNADLPPGVAPPGPPGGMNMNYRGPMSMMGGYMGGPPPMGGPLGPPPMGGGPPKPVPPPPPMAPAPPPDIDSDVPEN